MKETLNGGESVELELKENGKEEKQKKEEREFHDPYAAPDGGWGWIVMIASFLCNLVLDGIGYTQGVFLGPLMDHYKQEKGPVSLVGGILTGTIQLVGPFVAILVNKYGTRIVCIAGAAVSALGFFISTFSPNIPVLMVFYSLLGGVGLGLMYVPAVVAVGYYFDKRRALATGISVCGSGAGAFVMAPLASVLLVNFGWQAAIYAFSVLCLLCSLCGLTMRPLPKRPGPVKDEQTEAENCCRSVVSSACSADLMTNVPFGLLALANLWSTQGLYIPYMFLPKLAQSQGILPIDAAFLISIVGICNTIGRIISGAFTDLPFVSPLVVTTISLGLGGLCSVLMTVCSSYWSFALVSALFGVCLSAWCAVTPPALVEIAGVDLLTSAFGTLTFVRGVAALIGPPMAGYIVDWTGDENFAFYISCGLLAVSSVICGLSWLVKKRRDA